MTTRIADIDLLKNWLNKQSGRYVVLREKRANGTLSELNLLADMELAYRLEEKFPRAREGVKVDIYGMQRADYLGFPHLPKGLAEACLQKRTLESNNGPSIANSGWYRAAPVHELEALLYHLCYHKPEKSGFLQDTITPFNKPASDSIYAERVQQLIGTTGAPALMTLQQVHGWLSERQLGLDTERLQTYVRYQFARGIKSYFHAWLMNQTHGELNLFVIRGVAVKFKQADALLEQLSRQYQIIATRTVPWHQRLMRMRHMRGGKWKRGGKPHLAVVVFDPNPMATSEAERHVHPFVFNARQFIKRDWRMWFSGATGARPQDNPIHSTDNEAEAIGHLPLFFDDGEQQHILAQLAVSRATTASQSKAHSDVS